MTMSSKTEVVYQWPDVMATPRAAEFCDVSQAAINKARREGVLPAAGRRGGKGAFTFNKADLESWMRGAAS